jgi:hypothetical protein
MQLTVHHDQPYLVVVVSGPASLADHFGFVALISGICAATHCRRCLLDLRAVQAELAFTEYLRLGTFVGETLQHLDRIAALVPPDMPKGISVKAAQKAGVPVRSFSNIDEAKAWLDS